VPVRRNTACQSFSRSARPIRIGRAQHVVSGENCTCPPPPPRHFTNSSPSHLPSPPSPSHTFLSHFYSLPPQSPHLRSATAAASAATAAASAATRAEAEKLPGTNTRSRPRPPGRTSGPDLRRRKTAAERGPGRLARDWGAVRWAGPTRSAIRRICGWAEVAREGAGPPRGASTREELKPKIFGIVV
jgi:hypothetical protein